MKLLTDMLGCEFELDQVARAIKYHVTAQRPPVVGAMHVTCADESERECVESFQQWFVHELLPELKFFSRSAFRLANLGARYEWGSLAIAENHFALAASAESFKTLVVKINAHVSASGPNDDVHYGRMSRYDQQSVYCGGLSALLDGIAAPFVDDLREAFQSEGRDRLAVLRDPAQTDPRLRALLAAVTSSRLQSRRAVLEIQEHVSTTPTVYYVVPCVTVNRPQRDTELVCGLYTADCRTAGEAKVEYHGLGDDVSRHAVTYRGGLLRISDDQIDTPRPARDHRQLVHQEWKHTYRQALRGHEHVVRAVRDAVHKSDHRYAREMLKSLVWALADFAPVPAAAILFAKGLVGIHNIYRAHRLAVAGREPSAHAAHEDATAMLDELKERIEHLSPEAARALLDVLVEEHADPGEVQMVRAEVAEG